MVKKVLVWGTVALLIFYMAYAPESIASIFKAIGGGIFDVAEAFGNFFRSLVS